MNRIHRTKQSGNFTIIPNTIFKSGLSLRSIGLLTYILHLPDDWILYKTYLYENLPEGREAINTAWKQLEEKGFILSKRTTSKSTNLPETNYFVYDSPVKTADSPTAGNPDAGGTLPGTRQPKTRQLLKTKRQRTKKPSTKEQSTKNTGDADPAGRDAAPQGGADKKADVYGRAMDVYYRWFQKKNNAPPAINGAEGKALKALIAYFQQAVRDKSKTKGEILNDDALDQRIVDSIAFILENWPKLDSFLQGKTRLMDISSNISNIITQIRNGNHESKQQQRVKSPRVDVADVARAFFGNAAPAD